MANSSSPHEAVDMTSPQAHRSEVLENPLRVSLFTFVTVCSVKRKLVDHGSCVKIIKPSIYCSKPT